VQEQILVLFGIASRIAMNLDDLLLAIIIAGLGLAIVYLRAEFVLRRGRKVKERNKVIIQRELHANRLGLEQKHVPVTALQTHQHFLSKESGNRPDSATAQLSA
jgi:hypothetical protein